MGAQDFTITSIRNNLNKALSFAHAQRFAVGLEGKTADVDFIARLFGLFFGITKAGDLGDRVGGSRHHPVV
jgi:hypothetical protein